MRRAAAAVLLAAGALALADVALTLAWQEPVTALAAHREQSRLRAELRALDVTVPAPTGAQRRAAAAASARALRRRTRDGDALARLRIPRLGLDAVVVRGTRPDDLQHAPGLFDAARLPGERGTALIAGHRTTYGAPFHDVDKLDPGDRIQLSMPYGRFDYRVERTRIVPPTAVWVTNRVGYDRLVLSACHPLYSAAQRIIVFARLERAEARGPAAG